MERDELCSCREPFSACGFWGEVGRRAFGGWTAADAERVRVLGRRVGRQRDVPLLAVPRLPAGLAQAAEEYSSYFRRVYAAAHALTGGLVLDSSKHPSLAFALARDGLLDLRVLHIVRDSRGVAFSNRRWVRRPEVPGETSYMPRPGAGGSALTWLAHNAMFEGLAKQGVPLLRLRYEDLLRDPAGSLAGVREFAGLGPAGEAAPRPRDDRAARTVHSVAGNPLRFSETPLRLRVDDAWRREMPPSERRLVWALTAPLALAYGYRSAAGEEPAPAGSLR